MNKCDDKQSTDSTPEERFSVGLHPFRFFLGYDVLVCEEEEMPLLIELCRTLGINYRSVKSKTSGKRALCVPFFSSSKLLISSANHNIPTLKRVRRGGLPALLLENKSRIGIPLGIVAVIIAIFLSQNVIWDIRIDGNDRVSDNEITQMLEECGLYVGVKKRGMNTLKIENGVLILSDDIGWISVNIIGCVAEVNVKELDLKTESDVDSDASNVVSSANGTIIGFENIRGNISVNIGDEVSEGQLLIGGIQGVCYIGIQIKVSAVTDVGVIGFVAHQKRHEICLILGSNTALMRHFVRRGIG